MKLWYLQCLLKHALLRFRKDTPYCTQQCRWIFQLSQNVGLGKSAALNRIGIGNGSADHRHSWSTACNTASITLKKTWLGNTCCAEWCCESWRVKICGQESRQQASEKCFGQMWSIGKSPGTSQEGFRWTAIDESWGAGKANRRCMVGDILLVKAV